MKEQDTGEYDMLAELVDEIHAVLDGVEWSADTCQEIANLLQAAGYTVRELIEWAPCGSCGGEHPAGFNGDCRDDANRRP